MQLVLQRPNDSCYGVATKRTNTKEAVQCFVGKEGFHCGRCAMSCLGFLQSRASARIDVMRGKQPAQNSNLIGQDTMHIDRPQPQSTSYSRTNWRTEPSYGNNEIRSFEQVIIIFCTVRSTNSSANSKSLLRIAILSKPRLKSNDESHGYWGNLEVGVMLFAVSRGQHDAEAVHGSVAASKPKQYIPQVLCFI